MQITDNLLYKYVPKAEELILEQIPLEEQLKHTFSKDFERKMRKLFMQNRQNSSKFLNQTKRVAIIFLIIIAVTFTTIMTAEALRIKFFEMITKIYHDLTSITFVTDDEPTELEFLAMVPQYIPEGFQITEEEKTFTTTYTVYSNQSGTQIIFEQSYVTNNERIIDTEGTEIENLLINELNVQYFYNKQIHQFMWTHREYFFSLISSFDKIELIKMIESME